MPQQVQHTVPAPSVKVNDIFIALADDVDAKRNFGTVEDVTTGTKWTVITTSTGRTRIEADREVVVTRTELTEEEKAAEKDEERKQMRAQVNRLIRNAIDKAPDELATAKAKFVATLDFMLDSWSLESFGLAQGQARLWARVGEIAERRDDMDLVDIVKAVAQDEQRKLIDGFRGLSRSTSQTTNLLEDMRREAVTKWLDTVRFYAVD
jgi:hypothetical protein